MMTLAERIRKSGTVRSGLTTPRGTDSDTAVRALLAIEEERDQFLQALESAQTLIETGSPQIALATIKAALISE